MKTRSSNRKRRKLQALHTEALLSMQALHTEALLGMQALHIEALLGMQALHTESTFCGGCGRRILVEQSISWKF